MYCSTFSMMSFDVKLEYFNAQLGKDFENVVYITLKKNQILPL